MSALLRFAAAFLLLTGWVAARTHTAYSQPSSIQQLFLGDKTCGDNPYDCSFANVTPTHRYLHVVLHDAAGAAGWQALVGADCSTATVAVGSIPMPVSTFLEVVVDVSTITGGTGTACFVFRGLGGQFVFYAAYLDDNPALDARQVYPGYEKLDGRPDLPDLDVAYIHRTPTYNYDAQPNRPAPGDQVTFTAHVLNVGGLEAPPFGYTWSLDGSVVASGMSSTPLSPRASVDFSFPWKWAHAPHDLTFTVQPAAQETSSTNNSLTIHTNALSLGFWVERSAYNYVNDHEWEYCLYWGCNGADSFEDWLQRQVGLWNQMLEKAGSPVWSPAGVADRVRLDKLVIVPDGALPLHGTLATNDPDITDHSVDLQWGLPTSEIGGSFFRFNTRPPSFDSDFAVMHELSHARYLADVYRFDVASDGSDVTDVRDKQGSPLYDAANPYDPSAKLHPVPSDQGQLLYQNLERDLMSCVCTSYYSAYNALVLNRIQGRRASCGNSNAPCNLGEWYLDVPPVNRLRILDAKGKPVARGSQVTLYFDSGTSYTGHAFHQSDSLALGTNKGVVQLPADPFRSRGSSWQAGHNDLLLEVTAGNHDDFCFVEPTTFNLAYWLGYRDTSHPAVFTYRLGSAVRNSCNLRLPKTIVNEPFSTSPYASSVNTKRSKAGWTISVHLVDALRHLMRNRFVRISDQSGRVLRSGTTNSRGNFAFKVASRPSAVHVLDVTDNNLVIR